MSERAAEPASAQRAEGSRAAEVPPLEALAEQSRRRRARSVDSAPPGESSAAGASAAVGPPRSVPRAPSGVIHETPKVLVLDLDETLVHSTLRTAPLWGLWGSMASEAPGTERSVGSVGGGRRGSSSLLSFLGLGMRSRGALAGVSSKLQPTTIEVFINGRSVLYQVYKRPWVDYFLRKVASWYQVVIFTASVQEYADPVIDWLDGGRGLISRRLFRDSCTLRNGSYIKDLERVERDLSRVCLVDNSPISYVLHEGACRVAPGAPTDQWQRMACPSRAGHTTRTVSYTHLTLPTIYSV